MKKKKTRSGQAIRSTPLLGNVDRTRRGFEMIEFRDRYDNPCSLQASSLAEYQKPGTSAVWLGVDDPKPQVLHGAAAALGIKTDATCGWVPYPIPEQVSLYTRMHLDRKQVAALIAHLQRWLDADTFELPNNSATCGADGQKAKGHTTSAP